MWISKKELENLKNRIEFLEKERDIERRIAELERLIQIQPELLMKKFAEDLQMVKSGSTINH